MPSRYDIFSDLNLVIEYLSGPVTMDALRAFIHELWSDPRYDPAYGNITDLSRASLMMNTREIIALGQFLLKEKKASTGKVAIITHTPFDTAMGLIFKQAVVDLNEVNVFTTWESACDFMDVDISDLPPTVKGSYPLALPVLA